MTGGARADAASETHPLLREPGDGLVEVRHPEADVVERRFVDARGTGRIDGLHEIEFDRQRPRTEAHDVLVDVLGLTPEATLDGEPEELDPETMERALVRVTDGDLLKTENSKGTGGHGAAGYHRTRRNTTFPRVAAPISPVILALLSIDTPEGVGVSSPVTMSLPRPSTAHLRRLSGWLLASVLALLLGLACRPTQPFVWASSLPAEKASPKPTDEPLHRGDTVAVVVEAQEPLNVTPTVTSDGYLVLPLVGAVPAEGRIPAELGAELTKLYARTIAEPRVSVIVVARRIEVAVIGEVENTGKFVLDSRDGIVSAIAAAGGLTEFADADSIYVVRATQPERIRFRMSDLVRGGDSATSFRLRDGDLVVVE